MEISDIKAYLKIDDDEENLYLQELMDVSLIYIDSMVGEGYKEDTKAVKLANLLQQKLIADMHENKGTEVASDTKADRIVVSILDKLSGYESISL